MSPEHDPDPKGPRYSTSFATESVIRNETFWLTTYKDRVAVENFIKSGTRETRAATTDATQNVLCDLRFT